jgi:hypothetical protein
MPSLIGATCTGKNAGTDASDECRMQEVSKPCRIDGRWNDGFWERRSR